MQMIKMLANDNQTLLGAASEGWAVVPDDYKEITGEEYA